MSAQSGHEQSNVISRGSGNRPSFGLARTAITSADSSPRSRATSEPILPVHRPTRRRQRGFAIGVMAMVTVYSSLPATCASTRPLAMARSTTEPLRA
jgi:hypothetical protein